MTTNTLFNTAAPVAGQANAGGGSGSTRSNGERAEAQLYLNIGVTMEVPDLDQEPDKDGNYPTKMEDLNIPLGVALDTQEPRKMGSGKGVSGQVWNQKVQVMNAVLQHLIDTGFAMDPGESQQITHIGEQPITVTLRRRGDQADRTPDASSNSLLQQLGKLSLVK